jgi:hypothetical protein
MIEMPIRLKVVSEPPDGNSRGSSSTTMTAAIQVP